MWASIFYIDLCVVTVKLAIFQIKNSTYVRESKEIYHLRKIRAKKIGTLVFFKVKFQSIEHSTHFLQCFSVISMSKYDFKKVNRKLF